MCALARAIRPDLLLGIKSLWMSPDTLAELPVPLKIHYHPDDSSNPDNVSARYLEGEPAWDLHVTTKSFNIDELKAAACIVNLCALCVDCAHDRDWHRHWTSQAAPRFNVAFIGTRRYDRTDLVHRIARVYGESFIVCGDKWGRSPTLRRQASVRPAQYGRAMAEVVASARVNLGLLANRDLRTCRTFEIPAAGGLFLGPRTAEHERLFDEGREALLFSSEEEMLALIRRALADPDWAGAVAAAGCRRVRDTGNTYEHRAAAILQHVGIS